MAEILLLHHAQGLTAGCLAFADELRAAGHVVHAPDIYDGKTFAELDDGIAYARKVGFDTMQERGRQAADGLADELVYVGFSLGAMPAQLLAQTRPGARGAVLLHASIPLSEFGGAWPAGVPLQIHTMEDDELGDVDVARELAETVDEAQVFLYPGDRHLFTDSSLPAYDEAAAAQVRRRVLAFLDGIG
ncbi:MAG TPA: dienelactone hydrolase family protein [Acidimicrobiales bacterium]|nr:dienelactone hydrolase family protein [Acidimicrobiales bacterium]